MQDNSVLLVGVFKLYQSLQQSRIFATIHMIMTLANLKIREILMKKILVLVSGTSPAIITETIYSLVNSPYNWVPDKIVVFTTQLGAQQIAKRIFESGVFAQMCAQLNTNCKFSMDDILVIQENGRRLDDIRSDEDNLIFANFVSKKIYELSNDEDSQLYVSLTGGRKTMSYFVGNAMTLYAREQDKLFHVLVNEPFNFTPEFMYPVIPPQRLTTFNGVEVSSQDALIEIAEIPFIKIRKIYPRKLIEGNISFAEAVDRIQSQINIDAYKLQIDLPRCELYCNESLIKLSASQFAIYSYFAWLKQISADYQTIKAMDIERVLTLFADALWKQGRTNAARYSQVENTLRGTSFESSIRSSISTINKKIRDGLGSNAGNYMIEHLIPLNSTINHYGIRILSKNITFI